MKNKLKITCMVLLALLIWFGMGLQFYISTTKYLQEGRTFGGAIVQILSYYTIQSNLLIGVALTAILLAPQSSWGRFFSKLSVLTAIAVYIAIVGLVYHFVLSKQFHLQGLFQLASDIFHVITPIAYMLFWLIFVQKGFLKWGESLYWLIYPFLYFIYAIIRGATSGYYPYSFIDATQISYQQIAINFVFLLLAFLGMCLLFILINRLLSKQKAS